MISWGGLRGAVGLALALVVAQTSAIDFDLIGSKVSKHTTLEPKLMRTHNLIEMSPLVLHC